MNAKIRHNNITHLALSDDRNKVEMGECRWLACTCWSHVGPTDNAHSVPTYACTFLYTTPPSHNLLLLIPCLIQSDQLPRRLKSSNGRDVTKRAIIDVNSLFLGEIMMIKPRLSLNRCRHGHSTICAASQAMSPGILGRGLLQTPEALYHQPPPPPHPPPPLPHPTAV